ncbi:WAC protein, partial [Polypterus senegalus]
MTETTDCREQRLRAVLPHHSTPASQWFILLLSPQALFLLVLLLSSLVISQRSLLLQMELLLCRNYPHLHPPPLYRKQKGKSATVDKPSSHSCTSQSSSSTSVLNPAAQPPSASTVPVSPVPQSPVPPLLQDPNLLRQLLPALQATLQLNNANVDMSKINEVLTAAVTQASLQSMLHKILTAGPSAFNITTLLSQAAQLSTPAQQSNQSPMSLTSDASSPRSYVSPRISTPQTNTIPHKPMINTPPVSSQPKVSTPVVKQGPAPQPIPQQPLPADKQHGHEPASPRTLQRSRCVHFYSIQDILSSQRSPSPGVNHIPSNTVSSGTASASQSASTRPTCTFTPTLAAHFNENLIKHVQGWPADHAEKQASRLREEAHNMGSIHMSEICTELKNLRSLVRVCEIQATLREQRKGLNLRGQWKIQAGHSNRGFGDKKGPLAHSSCPHDYRTSPDAYHLDQASRRRFCSTSVRSDCCVRFMIE